MKHAIITLIIVFLFVLIVVPLIFIALGKLKNPIDLFALSKVGNSGAVTKQPNFISPNYIPESGNASKTRSTSDSYKKLVDDVNNCFKKESIHIVSDEYFSLAKLPDEQASAQTSVQSSAPSSDERALNIKNNFTGTSRFFDGFYPTVETQKSIGSKPNTLSTTGFITRPGCAANGTSPTNLLTGFNDTGILMQRMAQNELNGFDFTNKGLVTINGIAYYWYLFEDKNRLYAQPDDEVFYAAMYSTLWNSIYYIHTFEGSSLTFGTSRDFLNQTQLFLSGTVYGTSTPTVYPTSPSR